MCKVCQWVGVYLLNVAMWFDTGVNVWVLPWLALIGVIPSDPALGCAHYTVSQWSGYAALKGSRLAKGFCWLLTKIWGLWEKKPGYDHCYDAIHNEDGTLIPPTEHEG